MAFPINFDLKNIKNLFALSDIFVAVLLISIIGMMIVPLPTFVLDILITLNIAFALTIILVAMYLREPLEFAAFPSILLIVTLFRLSLNIAASRLILLQANAGEVISAFGNFVVRGNYIVGAIIFVIITIVQFVVITRGSERVAEVAARFTLDAMPGKQMSIDADLNAGLIDANEARARRRKIEQEATFFGSMDGANKFVRGDAIAGIIIVLVNSIGGILVGWLQHGMGIMEALSTYALLTCRRRACHPDPRPAYFNSNRPRHYKVRIGNEPRDRCCNTDVRAAKGFRICFSDPRVFCDNPWTSDGPIPDPCGF